MRADRAGGVRNHWVHGVCPEVRSAAVQPGEASARRQGDLWAKGGQRRPERPGSGSAEGSGWLGAVHRKEGHRENAAAGCRARPLLEAARRAPVAVTVAERTNGRQRVYCRLRGVRSCGSTNLSRGIDTRESCFCRSLQKAEGPYLFLTTALRLPQSCQGPSPAVQWLKMTEVYFLTVRESS